VHEYSLPLHPTQYRSLRRRKKAAIILQNFKVGKVHLYGDIIAAYAASAALSSLTKSAFGVTDFDL